MDIKERIKQQLTEAKVMDPLANEYTARIKKLARLKWDPAKASYEKPGQPEKEGASTSVSGNIKGKWVSFVFSHPEVVGGRMVTGWVFNYAEEENKKLFAGTGDKILKKTAVSPPIKRMAAWKEISDSERRQNLAELDAAIKKFS